MVVVRVASSAVAVVVEVVADRVDPAVLAASAVVAVAASAAVASAAVALAAVVAEADSKKRLYLSYTSIEY